MSYSYDYTREYGDTIHSSPDTYNVGHEGEPESMTHRVQDELGKSCSIMCSGTLLRFTFETELTSQEETDLTAAVAAQKAVDDWPYEQPDLNHCYATALAETESTSTIYVPKVSLTTPLLTGTFDLDFYIMVGIGPKNYKMHLRVQETIGDTTEAYAKYHFVRADDDRIFSGGISEIVFANESKTFEIQIKNNNSGCTRRMSYARLDLRRDT